MKKTVLVTGATYGTGYAIAARFARQGYNAVLTSRNGAQAQAAAARLGAEYPDVSVYGVELTVCDEAGVDAVFADIEAKGYTVDTVVLNAANLGIAQDTLTVRGDAFHDVIYTNIIWNYLIARRAAKTMQTRGAGAIVFINSNTAYRAIPARAAYCASKSGALGLMRALAIDLGVYGIRVNAVLPGMIKTKRWEDNYNDCRNAMSNYTPLGDIATFEDIANAAWFLGSDESRNVTGSELVVDGGNTAQLCPTLPNNVRVVKED